MLVALGMIALFPQAIVPAVMKLTGDVARVWFLALYLPGPWQWPTIAFMAMLGIGALVLAWRTRQLSQAALVPSRITSPVTLVFAPDPSHRARAATSSGVETRPWGVDAPAGRRSRAEAFGAGGRGVKRCDS